MRKVFLFIAFLVSIFSFNEISNDNETVVANYFNYLFNKGDFESIKKIIADDAVYTQAEGLPYGGIYKGFGEWMQMFKKVQTYVDLSLAEEPVLFSNSHNNKVAANFSVKFKSKKNHKELTMRITELFELRAGMILSITPYYFDTKAISDFIKEE